MVFLRHSFVDGEAVDRDLGALARIRPELGKNGEESSNNRAENADGEADEAKRGHATPDR